MFSLKKLFFTSPVIQSLIANRFDKAAQRKAACALNLLMVSMSQIIDYNDEEILKLEYDSVLNNLNIEKIIHDKEMLVAITKFMDVCHFFILHAKDKEMLKKKQELRLRGALANAFGGNMLAIVASGNPWVVAAGIATMVGVAAINYKSQRDKAKLENELDAWELEKSALEQLHILRRSMFETAWHLETRYHYPDTYRLSEKQISIYNDILRIPDPVERCERLDLFKDHFQAYPHFWYYLGRAALEAAECYRPLTGAKNERRHYFEGTEANKELYEHYTTRAKESYAQFREVYQGNEFMREDLIAAASYLDSAFLEPENQEFFADKACQLAELNVEIQQRCAFMYLDMYKSGKRNCLEKAEKCLRFLLCQDYNSQTNTIALSYLYKKTEKTKEYSLLESCVKKQHAFVWNRLYVEEEEYKKKVEEFINGDGPSRLLTDTFDALIRYRCKDFFQNLQAFLKDPSVEITVDDTKLKAPLYINVSKKEPNKLLKKTQDSVFLRQIEDHINKNIETIISAIQELKQAIDKVKPGWCYRTTHSQRAISVQLAKIPSLIEVFENDFKARVVNKFVASFIKNKKSDWQQDDYQSGKPGGVGTFFSFCDQETEILQQLIEMKENRISQ